MKMRLIATAMIALPTLAACATSSVDRANRAEAWSRCRTAPDPETRDRCIETEIALMQASQERDAASRAAAEKQDEAFEALNEPRGVPQHWSSERPEFGRGVPKR